MITDTYKWASSRRYIFPVSAEVNFPVLDLASDTEVNIPNRCSSTGYLNISGGFTSVYGYGYHDNRTPTNYYMCVLLGTGTTPPAASDRDMEAYVADFTYITSGVGAVNQSDSIGTYDEFIVSYRYTGATEVTISEVGINMRIEGQSSSYGYSVLVEHSLLATPKVMNTNDTITLSVKLYHTGAIALS